MMRPFFYGDVFAGLSTFRSFGLQLCAFRLRAEARYENIVALDCNINDDGSLALHYKEALGCFIPPPSVREFSEWTTDTHRADTIGCAAFYWEPS